MAEMEVYGRCSTCTRSHCPHCSHNVTRTGIATQASISLLALRQDVKGA